jgi:hypothetical protein
MTPPKRDDAREAPPAAPEGKKKRYQKPEFVREQLFETMALACGKTNPVIGQCKAVRKNS